MPYTLHRGDALTALAGIPDNSVDAVITDPPYNSGGRTSSERTSRTARTKYTSVDAEHDLANFPGETAISARTATGSPSCSPSPTA